ncbi:F0F1 ATP synthase subunit gamma, partial [Klebsiella pneumoniae]|nr:F0F1 ATP synthase subunit gamma [Klebsiella pneumoniae]
GLAGAFNSNVIKGVTSLIAEKYSAQMNAGNVEFLTIGKKGFENLTKKGFTTIGDFATVFTNLSFDTIRPAAELAMEGFRTGRYDAVEL